MFLECPKHLKEFAWLVCEYLDMVDLPGDVYIRTSSELKEEHGECYGDMQEAEVVLSNVVNPKIRDMREALAHELVHARQFLRGELDMESGYPIGTVFKKKYYPYETPYLEEPWEQEAHKLEKEIMDLFYPEKTCKVIETN